MTSAAILVPHRVVDAVGYQVDSRILLLVAAMALWGVSEGNGPVVESIFADSVPTGGRAGVYTSAFALYVASSSAGQFIAAGIFYLNGNTWSVHLLGQVILVGMLVGLVPAFCLSLFDDDKALGAESEALLSSHAEGEGMDYKKTARSWTSVSFLVPAVLLTSDAVFGLAAGMTVKFFPLFFKEKVALSPGVTNVVMAAIPLALAPLCFVSKRVSKYLGRVPTIMMFETIGVSSMAIMGLYPSLWPRCR